MKYVAFLLIIVVLVSGCIDTTTQPIIEKPNIEISSPYSSGSNIISLSIDTTVSVPIDNPRNDDILIEIIEAKIIIDYKDGTTSSVNGYGNSINILKKTTSNLILEFRNLPIKYELKTNPLLLESKIKEYVVSVKYRGTLKIVDIIPYSVENIYKQTINMQNISLDENMFFKKSIIK